MVCSARAISPISSPRAWSSARASLERSPCAISFNWLTKTPSGAAMPRVRTMPAKIAPAIANRLPAIRVVQMVLAASLSSFSPSTIRFSWNTAASFALARRTADVVEYARKSRDASPDLPAFKSAITRSAAAAEDWTISAISTPCLMLVGLSASILNSSSESVRLLRFSAIWARKSSLAFPATTMLPIAWPMAAVSPVIISANRAFVARWIMVTILCSVLRLLHSDSPDRIDQKKHDGSQRDSDLFSNFHVR